MPATRERFRRARRVRPVFRELLVAMVTLLVVGSGVFLTTADRPDLSALGSAPGVASAAGAPTGPAPTEPAPTGPAPFGPAPIGSGPFGSGPFGSGPTGSGPTDPAPTGPAPTADVPTDDTSAPAEQITYPTQGQGDWIFADGRGAVGGTEGSLLRYRVAVEKGIGQLDVDYFAGQVSTTLSDPRSWVGTRQVRLQRMGARDNADFVIYLATPATRAKLCGSERDRYTSCRSGDRVVINVARWAHGAEAVGADLASYRQYVINHEVGHRLGHGHELCPGEGEPAPVMQQQTLGLHGCRPYAWPMRDGEAYSGRSGSYDDPTPPA